MYTWVVREIFSWADQFINLKDDDNGIMGGFAFKCFKKFY